MGRHRQTGLDADRIGHEVFAAAEIKDFLRSPIHFRKHIAGCWKWHRPFRPGGGLATLDDCEDSLTLVNAGAEVARAAAWLESFAGRAGLPSDITSKLQVALDETLSNVFTHALADAAEGARQVGLGLRRLIGRVELEVTDDGPEFDPTRALVDSAATRITERRPGGVGLLFVKCLIDEMHFIRQDGHNRLIMAVHLPTAG
jgi:serine/threonine-protein kinase RsbW